MPSSAPGHEARPTPQAASASASPAAGQGHPDRLFSDIYDRLKAMASRRLAGNRGATLNTTALVHELYLRIGSERGTTFAHEGQFFAYAARAMRHLLIDRARARLSQRAGGGWQRITLNESQEPVLLASAEQVLDLDAALGRLAAVDARAAQVIELRYFAGLTAEQAAQALQVSKRTCDSDWTFAIAFLRAELG